MCMLILVVHVEDTGHLVSVHRYIVGGQLILAWACNLKQGVQDSVVKGLDSSVSK